MFFLLLLFLRFSESQENVDFSLLFAQTPGRTQNFDQHSNLKLNGNCTIMTNFQKQPKQITNQKILFLHLFHKHCIDAQRQQNTRKQQNYNKIIMK